MTDEGEGEEMERLRASPSVLASTNSGGPGPWSSAGAVQIAVKRLKGFLDNASIEYGDVSAFSLRDGIRGAFNRIEALEAERDSLKTALNYEQGVYAEALDREATLAARVEALEEAIRPFALSTPRMNAEAPDDKVFFGWTGRHAVTMGDFRRATKVLAAIPPEQPTTSPLGGDEQSASCEQGERTIASENTHAE